MQTMRRSSFLDEVRDRRDDYRNRPDRQTALDTRVVVHQTRKAMLQELGARRLARAVMEGVVEVNNYRYELGGDDPLVHQLLGEVQGTYNGQVKVIQRSLYDPLGL